MLKYQDMSLTCVLLSDHTIKSIDVFNFSFWLLGLTHSFISWNFFDASTLCWPSVNQKSHFLIAGHISSVGIFLWPWGMTTIVCLSPLDCSQPIKVIILSTYDFNLLEHTSLVAQGGTQILTLNLKSLPMKKQCKHLDVKLFMVFWIYVASTSSVGTRKHQKIRVDEFWCLIRIFPGDLSVIQGFCEV